MSQSRESLDCTKTNEKSLHSIKGGEKALHNTKVSEKSLHSIKASEKALHNTKVSEKSLHSTKANEESFDKANTSRDSWYVYYLSVGSNLGDRAQYLNTAVRRLKEHPQIKQVVPSSWLETEPWGNTDQGPFLNGVVKVVTSLEPEALLDYMQLLEREAKRERKVHWGPRTLDLDIVWGQDDSGEVIQYESNRLRIPHPYMWDRTFVLEPLKELYPDFRKDGQCIDERIKELQAVLTHS